jgi:hypothetical protein
MVGIFVVRKTKKKAAQKRQRAALKVSEERLECARRKIKQVGSSDATAHCLRSGLICATLSIEEFGSHAGCIFLEWQK